jgi:hypothetical protein
MVLPFFTLTPSGARTEHRKATRLSRIDFWVWFTTKSDFMRNFLRTRVVSQIVSHNTVLSIPLNRRLQITMIRI